MNRARPDDSHEPVVFAVEDSLDLPPPFEDTLFDLGGHRELGNELPRRYESLGTPDPNVSCQCLQHICVPLLISRFNFENPSSSHIS